MGADRYPIGPNRFLDVFRLARNFRSTIVLKPALLNDLIMT